MENSQAFILKLPSLYISLIWLELVSSCRPVIYQLLHWFMFWVLWQRRCLYYFRWFYLVCDETVSIRSSKNCSRTSSVVCVSWFSWWSDFISSFSGQGISSNIELLYEKAERECSRSVNGAKISFSCCFVIVALINVAIFVNAIVLRRIELSPEIYVHKIRYFFNKFIPWHS